jgi:hypothetical protein
LGCLELLVLLWFCLILVTSGSKAVGVKACTLAAHSRCGRRADCGVVCGGTCVLLAWEVLLALTGQALVSAPIPKTLVPLVLRCVG